MFLRKKVVDIELSRPLRDLAGLDGYGAVQGLVRLHGAPLGYVQVPLVQGHCSATVLRQLILAQHGPAIVRHLLGDWLATPTPAGDDPAALLAATCPAPAATPLVTVAVCTRDRTRQLADCLAALRALDYPALDVLVVDNAPSDDQTARLVRDDFPDMRYVVEPRPGLDHARNRAIVEARGEIVAFTDDDVIVDAGWVRALAAVFAEDADVMAVTGLVVPYELETEAQQLFETYGGFGRGFERKWYQANVRDGQLAALDHGGSGKFGTGANMAFRRSLFDRIGLFDPALDVGTVTNGGGDLEMFFRVLKEGHTLVYEPRAIVRHRHRPSYEHLRTQITNNGIGFYAYLVRSALAYPDEAPAFLWLGLWWLWWWNVRRLLRSLTRPSRFPRDLILAELWGSFVGLSRYRQARRVVTETVDCPARPPERALKQWLRPLFRRSLALAVRTVDLDESLQPLTDVGAYKGVEVVVKRSDLMVGRFTMWNHYHPVSVARLRDALVAHLGLRLVEQRHLADYLNEADVFHRISEHLCVVEEPAVPRAAPLPSEVPVSIVVATYDRPDDLRICLQGLLAQKSERPVEIIVVDNHPASGVTPPVVAEFPQVVLVQEARRGLSYARNAGILASSGEIIAVTDDDVVLPNDWLEKLIGPLERDDVVGVTGNTLPLEMETTAQYLFETYGGLGRGFERKEATGTWFEQYRFRAVPTWDIGATANAAFRAWIFRDPRIGLMNEALGAGTAVGCSEDTYLFYKILKAGYTMVYEPHAFVWHKHRRTMGALRRQIYNYSKGHVAYHLTTLLQDGDGRALVRLGVELPMTHMWRIYERLRGRSGYPLLLGLIEIAGNLMGPWALWQSTRRVEQEGRSAPPPSAVEPQADTSALQRYPVG